MKTQAIKLLRRLAAVALFAPAMALAAGAALQLDKAPVSTDQQKLQRGAELFVKYCLNCHSASFVRYTALREIGLDDQTITDKLLYTSDKIGDLMIVALARDDAEAWFGIAPPDLSVIARAKASEFGSGADYLYTYLRSFYKDENRPTGWNNKVLANAAMPHAMWDMQGEQTAVEDDDGHGGKTVRLVAPTTRGSMSAEEYDEAIADLVSFMVWMGEPVAGKRVFIGIFVIIFLAAYYVLTHKLGKSYWKNIH
ncbi:MAG: cytochrome c1 [Betaproteobacteria bacterium]|nr:cytochrome c1 [Betaproteobacteria bacterium]